MDSATIAMTAVEIAEKVIFSEELCKERSESAEVLAIVCNTLTIAIRSTFPLGMVCLQWAEGITQSSTTSYAIRCLDREYQRAAKRTSRCMHS